MRKFSVLFAGLFLAICLNACLSPIRTVTPPQDSVVSHMRSDWQDILNERKQITVPADVTLDYKDALGFPVPVVFSWQTNDNGPYTLEISQDQDFSEIERRITTDSRKIEVYNLYSGKTYFWRIRSNRSQSRASSFATRPDVIRQIMVSPSGPVNVRDWGGKTMANGHRTKQGMLYRGTQMEVPFELTEEGRQIMLNDLQIHTDLDLRYEHQVADMTESPLGKCVQWLHYAINAYYSFEEQNRPVQFPLWRDALRIFADPDNYPVYFHCYGGVDRTGEIALLLDFLLGVDEEQAFLDYEFSSMANFPRMRTIPYLQEWLRNISEFDQSPEATWQSKTEKFMLAIGITPEEIAAIRANLTE